MPPDVSIAIVAYRSRHYLPGCVQGLAAQTHRNFEAIIVVNGETDDSVDGLELPDDRFKIVRMSENVGFAPANNHAAQMSSGKWLALLNPDAVPKPTWLAELLAATERWPGAASFGSTQLCLEDPTMLDGVGDVWHLSGLAWRARNGWPAADIPLEGEVFGPCAAAALYDREVFLALGGFDESYFCYCEDVDIAFRLRIAGYTSVQVPSAVVLHAGSAISGRKSEFSQYHGHRNRVWTYVKDTPGPWVFLLLPLHIAANILVLAKATIDGTGRAVARSYVSAVRDLPRILRARRQVQATRTVPSKKILAAMAWGISAPFTRELQVGWHTPAAQRTNAQD
ncbi:MAG: glycosyltransferase family 2 protein [Hyphomicrobium sp.]|jgi:GT2 family glycosyltransferase